HHDLLDDFAQVLALAMPSHNETFGMVFPEALFAGAPILYSRATGIDGYLDGLDVGVAVDPGNVDAIARGLVRLVEDNAHYRQNIRDAAAT
ncbi:glycosyltransferase, partial [Acinetobacter baumannii]